MKETTIRCKQKRFLALAAVAAVLLAAAVGAYAADVGGVQKTIRVWFHGASHDVAISERTDGGYDFRYTGENGEPHELAASGVYVDENGEERPMTPEEILDGNELDVVEKDGGGFILYYRDKTFDLTKLLDENGGCKVCFKENDQPFGKTVYVDVYPDGSWSVGYCSDGNGGYISLDD
ncbi:MAG: hypothetical protein IKN72_09915 [Clostridia bacterium]|nr:hypothetical protein [Clostridia bacterium]